MLRLLLISTLAVAIYIISAWYNKEIETTHKKCSRDFWNAMDYTWNNCIVVKEEWRECIGIAENSANNAFLKCLDNNLLYRFKRKFTL
jgi:hypothetical protein